MKTKISATHAIDNSVVVNRAIATVKSEPFISMRPSDDVAQPFLQTAKTSTAWAINDIVSSHRKRTFFGHSSRVGIVDIPISTGEGWHSAETWAKQTRHVLRVKREEANGGHFVFPIDKLLTFFTRDYWQGKTLSRRTHATCKFRSTEPTFGKHTGLLCFPEAEGETMTRLFSVLLPIFWAGAQSRA